LQLSRQPRERHRPRHGESLNGNTEHHDGVEVKFQRNAKMFQGQFEAAPFVTVAFIVVLFFVVEGTLVFTPGVKVQLPAAEGFSGTSNPTIAIAVDRAGQFYLENQSIKEEGLRAALQRAVDEARAPLTLVIQADEGVSHEAIVRLSKLARDLGIHEE